MDKLGFNWIFKPPGGAILKVPAKSQLLTLGMRMWMKWEDDDNNDDYNDDNNKYENNNIDKKIIISFLKESQNFM